MAKSIKKNYIYNLSYQILILLTPLITAPYISRVLGADGLGAVSYAESIVAYFTLFGSLGIRTYGQRQISYVQDDIDKRSEVFWNTKILEWITSGIALIAYFIFIKATDRSTLYWVMILSIFSDLLDIAWFFQGIEEFGEIVIRNSIVRIINIIWIFVLVKTKDDLNLYAFGLMGTTTFSNLFLWTALPGRVHRVPLKQLRPLTGFHTVIALFIPEIAMSIYNVMDKTMLGAITGNDFESGYYLQATSISKIVMAVVTSLGMVLAPRIGYYFEKGMKKEASDLMYEGYRTTWMLAIPLCLGLMIVSRNFIPWFFGPGYEPVPALLAILSLLIIAVGLNRLTGVQYLIPTKRENLYTLSVVIGALINFTLNSIFIPGYASKGAAAASVIAEFSIASIQLYMVRHELSIPKILSLSLHYLIAGGIMAAVLLVEDRFFTSGIVQSLIMVCSGIAVYALVLYLLHDDFFLSNADSLLRKFRRRGKRNSTGC